MPSGMVMSFRKRRWFGGYTDSWEGRCLICNQIVTKYDHTKEEAADYVIEHIRKEHPGAKDVPRPSTPDPYLRGDIK